MFKNLGDIFSRSENLEKLALIDLKESRPRFFTYKQLSDSTNSVADLLRKKQFSIQNKIGILSDNSAEFISAFFGSLKYGAEVVLINKKFKEDQIKNIIEECDIKLLFSDIEIATDIEITRLDNTLFDRNIDFNFIKVTDDQTAFTMYTSGSSGIPKKVKITHKDHIRNIIRAASFDSWSKNRISLIASPLYHSSGLTSLEGSLYGNSTVVLMPKFKVQQFLKTIEKFKINTVFCVPSMLAMSLTEDEKYDLTSVKTIRSASAPLTEKLIADTKKLFNNAKIINSYGCTELGPGLFGPHPMKIDRPEHSVGYPVNNIEYKLEEDVLHIKFEGDIDWYDTGDRFTVDQNGFYYFLGRSDDLFKSGGNKIYPAEVERILDSHESVLSSAVVGIEDEIKGFKPYAFIIPRIQKEFSESTLKDYFLKNYPEYLHPRRVWPITVFPLTGSNKIDKQQLKDLAIYNLTTGL